MRKEMIAQRAQRNGMNARRKLAEDQAERRAAKLAQRFAASSSPKKRKPKVKVKGKGRKKKLSKTKRGGNSSPASSVGAAVASVVRVKRKLKGKKRHGARSRTAVNPTTSAERMMLTHTLDELMSRQAPRSASEPRSSRNNASKSGRRKKAFGY